MSGLTSKLFEIHSLLIAIDHLHCKSYTLRGPKLQILLHKVAGQAVSVPTSSEAHYIGPEGHFDHVEPVNTPPEVHLGHEEPARSPLFLTPLSGPPLSVHCPPKKDEKVMQADGEL